MYYYIVNPTSGKAKINSIQDKLRSRLQELGIAGEFVKTTASGDATRLAKLAIEKGFSTIVAIGGDATVNEVINGVTGDTAIGIIPIGNTNNLADNLGIRSWQQACDVLSARRLVSFGLIAAGQNFFLSTLTLGFETDMGKHVDVSGTGLTNRVRQLREGLFHAASYEPLACHIQVDDRFQLDGKLFSLSVANQKFLNPAADNKLIVSMSDKPSRSQITTYLWRLLRRDEAVDDATTTSFTANRLVIQTTPSTGLTIDGKIAGRTPIAIRLTDRRIRFITEKPPTGFKA